MNRKELAANFLLVILVGAPMGIMFAGMENAEPSQVMSTLFAGVFLFALLNYPVHKILGD